MTNKTDANGCIAVKPQQYQEALILAEAGQCDQALACIQEYLAGAPNDAEALNDTGTLLYSLGYTDEALNHLARAIDLLPDAPEIIWNLVEVYLADNQPHMAVEFFDRMEKLGILNVDLLNRTADVFLKNEQLDEALAILQRSLEIAPQQAVLLPMIDIIHSKIAERN